MFSPTEIEFSKDWIKTIYDLKKSLDTWAFENLQDLWNNEFNPSYMQFLFLIDSEGKTNSELAKLSGITKQAMSKIILQLIQKGLIVSISSSKDKRSSNIVLTEKGRLIVSESLNRFTMLVDGYRNEIGQQDLELSRHTLNIAKNFIKENK